jgi:hypothetical protein
MVDLSILSSDLQVVDPVSFPAIDSLASSPIDADSRTGNRPCACSCRDQVNWTPELWWLLNWWTWLFPPPDQNLSIDSVDCAGLYVVERIQIETNVGSDRSNETVPTLAMVEQVEQRDVGPPDQVDTVHRVINMGNGLIDLFA